MAELERIDDLQAIVLRGDEASRPFWTRLKTSAAAGLLRALPPSRWRSDLSSTHVAPFHRGGFRFLQYGRGGLRDWSTNQLLGTPPGPVRPVYRDAEDHLLIGTNRLCVKFSRRLAPAEMQAFVARTGLAPLTGLAFGENLHVFTLPPASDPLEVVEKLGGDSTVSFAEPVFVEHLPGRATASDPDLGKQWQWKNTGSGGGKAGADVRAEEAWKVTRGAGVTVAVVDNGFDVAHQDYRAGISPFSGYFEKGGQFTRNLEKFPRSKHGTFCAGMVGARQNNALGGSGAAPECSLMLVACLEDALGTQLTLARAIGYATKPTTEVKESSGAGADIISCSVGPKSGGWKSTLVLREALNNVSHGRNGLGTLVFWATSNENIDISRDDVCSHPNVVAVGRSTNRDTDDGSAHGEKLELLAPGKRVFSTIPGDRYGTLTGTSFAAPCAAGVAALALSVNPKLSARDLRQILKLSCDKIGGPYDASGHSRTHGFGRVNAVRAVRMAQEADVP